MLTISVFLNISSPYLTQISISRHVMALKQNKNSLMLAKNLNQELRVLSPKFENVRTLKTIAFTPTLG